MLTDRRLSRSEAGLSVAEVVMAATVVLVGLVACGRATSAAVAAQGRAAARDRALAATYDIADGLQADGCLLMTSAEVPDDQAAVAGRCRASLRLTGGLGLGEGVLDHGSTAYQFQYSSRWIAADAPAGLACGSPHYAKRPIGVERTVAVMYRERNTTRSRTRTSTIEAVPPDGYQQRSWQRSNLVVDAGDPVASAEISGPSGGSARRVADLNGCVWFPLLRSGTYQLKTTTRAGSTSTEVTGFVADPRATTAQVVTP